MLIIYKLSLNNTPNRYGDCITIKVYNKTSATKHFIQEVRRVLKVINKPSRYWMPNESTRYITLNIKAWGKKERENSYS